MKKNKRLENETYKYRAFYFLTY